MARGYRGSSGGSRSSGYRSSSAGRSGRSYSSARAHQHVGQSFGGYTKSSNGSSFWMSPTGGRPAK